MQEVSDAEVMPTTAIESMTRGEINSQIETAHRFPRSMERFKTRGTEMACIDDETAASCLYRRPVGKGDDGKQKFAEGMSIRMAEIVGAAYGNLRVYATIIDQTERQVVARGMAMDLESNFASSSEVVESTVDRNGRPYSERQRALMAKVALAKARRDATFQVVPKALARPIELAVRKLLHGDSKSMDKRQKEAVTWINSLGIDAKRVYRALEIEGAGDLGIEQLETLTGLRTAIKDGETSIDEAFPGEPVVRSVAGSAKSELMDAIGKLASDSADGKAILKRLTGKSFITNLTEAEAKEALEKFQAEQKGAAV